MSRTVFYPRCRAQVEVVFDGRGAANSRPLMMEIDPRSCTVGLNGFYEADTFQMEFDARLMPFDPDQVAYAAVRLYMWDADRNLDTSEWALDSNEMLRGLVDDIEGDIVGEDNVVRFTGRDYTAILVDPEWDPRDRIDAGGTLDAVVQNIADLAAPDGTTARFTVVWQGESDPPTVGGLHRAIKKKGVHVKPGKTYWDVIWDLCVQHAYVPRIVGSTIFIGEPKTETRKSLLSAPRLVYGKTLTRLSTQRKFDRETVPQIVVVAHDPVTEQQIEVKYPARRNITVGGAGSTDALGIPLTVKKDEQMFFPAPAGVTDRDALLRYARMRFYHLGRGETVYTMATRHLWIDGSIPGQEENLLQLRPGSAIGVRFDPFNREHLRALEIGQRVEHIKALGYSEAVSTFVSRNLDRMDMFRQDYYFNRGEVSYSVDDGIEIEIEAVNFASEIREVTFADSVSPGVL